MLFRSRMDLEETGTNTRNWVDSDLDRDHWRSLVNVALNPRVPWAMELVNHNVEIVRGKSYFDDEEEGS